MKIRFWDRLILFLGALLTVIAGLCMVAFGIQVLGTVSASIPLWMRVVSIALGALTALFGGYLFAFPRKFSYGRHDFVVQQTDNGELRIAVKAIENLVQKCIDMHEEIHVVSMKIRNCRDGVRVDLCISLANNIAIPLAVASLQKQIKQYLAASSGIEVKEVRVSVETAQAGVGDSPYLVSSEGAHPVPERQPEPKEKPKLPLHQRIFRRGDQAVTVPEPPKAENASQETDTQETPDAPTEAAGAEKEDAVHE